MDKTHLPHIVLTLLGFLVFSSDSITVKSFNVRLVSCVQGSTCPPGNPSFISMAFSLNGTIGRNVSLTVGSRLVLYLRTDVSFHPLTICKNSPFPLFCQGASSSNLLRTPITKAGQQLAYRFNTTGTYFYGCHRPSSIKGPRLSPMAFLVATDVLFSTRRLTRRNFMIAHRPHSSPKARLALFCPQRFFDRLFCARQDYKVSVYFSALRATGIHCNFPRLRNRLWLFCHSILCAILRKDAQPCAVPKENIAHAQIHRHCRETCQTWASKT